MSGHYRQLPLLPETNMTAIANWSEETNAEHGEVFTRCDPHRISTSTRGARLATNRSNTISNRRRGWAQGMRRLHARRTSKEQHRAQPNREQLPVQWGAP